MLKVPGCESTTNTPTKKIRTTNKYKNKKNKRNSEMRQNTNDTTRTRIRFEVLARTNYIHMYAPTLQRPKKTACQCHSSKYLLLLSVVYLKISYILYNVLYHEQFSEAEKRQINVTMAATHSPS